eukprot:1775559-Amphidinium_carterae.1
MDLSWRSSKPGGHRRRRTITRSRGLEQNETICAGVVSDSSELSMHREAPRPPEQPKSTKESKSRQKMRLGG